jgi:hypothetical protein
MVEEIAFAWASQTDHFKILIFSFSAFLSAKSKILKQKQFCTICEAFPEPHTKKIKNDENWRSRYELRVFLRGFLKA